MICSTKKMGVNIYLVHPPFLPGLVCNCTNDTKNEIMINLVSFFCPSNYSDSFLVQWYEAYSFVFISCYAFIKNGLSILKQLLIDFDKDADISKEQYINLKTFYFIVSWTSLLQLLLV